jgi:hypothetical protein
MDKMIGRVIAGLPAHSHEFATLPTHYKEVGSDFDLTDLGDALSAQFGTWADADGLKELLPFCLATLMEHFEWMTENLNPEHPVFSTPLFTSTVGADIEGHRVPAGMMSPHMSATGVPPLTLVMRDLHDLKQHVQDDAAFKAEVIARFDKLQDEIPGEIGEFLGEVIEKRAHEMGTLTTSGVAKIVADITAPMHAEILKLLEKRLPQTDGAFDGGVSGGHDDNDENHMAIDPAMPDGLFKTFEWVDKCDEFIAESSVPADFMVHDMVRLFPPLTHPYVNNHKCI